MHQNRGAEIINWHVHVDLHLALFDDQLHLQIRPEVIFTIVGVFQFAQNFFARVFEFFIFVAAPLDFQ